MKRWLVLGLALLPALGWASSPDPFFPRLHLALGASIDRGGLSADAGVRWAPAERFGLGVDVEFNPWVDLVSGTFAPGVVSVVGSGFWRLVRLEGVELRTTVHLGGSVLLFDAVGAPAGSLGAYVGLSALNATFALRPGLWLEVKPDVVVPIPQLRGVPFAYRQYRMTVGLEWAP